MTQEIKNILMLIVIPLLSGITVRLFFLKKRKGYILTIAEGAVSLLMLLLSALIDTGGNEYLGLWFIITTCLFAGSFATEFAIFISNRINKNICEKDDFIEEN